MITLKNISLRRGAKVLLDQTSVSLNPGEKVGLVGRNGAGKSSLFALLNKTLTEDSGEFDIPSQWRMGQVAQDMPETDASATDFVIEGDTELVAARAEVTAAEATDDGERMANAYMALHDAGEHDAASRAQALIQGLGFKTLELNKPVNSFSGGWRMRLQLARALMCPTELLLLDEPTNHLDLLSLLWLQNYLKNYSGALLLISHDRQFMDEVITQVHEISEKKLIAYTGNYADYLRQREERYEQHLSAYKNQQKEISDLQAFADRFRSIPSKASQAQSKLKQIERLELIEKPLAPRKPFRFQIPPPPRGGQRAISLEGIHMAYGAHSVYRGLDLSVERGERTVLVGPNGAGKSTLLKILAGVVPFQQGTRDLGHNAKIGYFSQHRADTLDPEKNVLEEVLASAPAMREDEARGVLGSFMFRKDDIFKKTAVLSGGEKSRLNLVKFLVDPPNLLLMDEPTTHLDIHTVESLTLALERYEGTLVFISHDVHFIRHLATKVLHVSAGTVTPYVGGYEYFLEKTGAADDARAALTAG